jgi:hypothetical protein
LRLGRPTPAIDFDDFFNNQPVLSRNFSYQRELYKFKLKARIYLSLPVKVTYFEIKPRRWLQPLKSSTRQSAPSMKVEGSRLVFLNLAAQI